MLTVYCAQFSNTATIRILSQTDRQIARRDCDGENEDGENGEYIIPYIYIYQVVKAAGLNDLTLCSS
jgi:hypothetical protein